MRSIMGICVTIFLVTGHAQGLDMHLFILSGQSNMDGLKAEKDFTPEVMKRLPGDQVVVVQDDERAQALRRWVPEWRAIASKHGYEDKNAPKHPDGDLYERLIRAVRERAGDAKFDSVTLIWMQGESDAMVKGYSPAYAEAFDTLVKRLRKDLNAPDMKVVIGRLSDFQGDDKPEWEMLREMQVTYANENDGCAWVDTDDLNDKEKNGTRINDLHYTREGYAVLGERFARQAALLIKGKQPAMDGRPQ